MHKNKQLNIILSTLTLFILVLLNLVPTRIFASAPSTYDIVIDDTADLFDDTEEANLKSIMNEIALYGNVALVTINENSTNATQYAQKYYTNYFGDEDGTLLLIDIDNRYIRIHSVGFVYSIITSGKANSIADNVYKLATNGNYYECAYQTFLQELKLLRGDYINEPMKHLCNAFFAITIALFANYFIVKKFHYGINASPENAEILNSINYSFELGGITTSTTSANSHYNSAHSNEFSSRNSFRGRSSSSNKRRTSSHQSHRSGSGSRRRSGGGGHRF